MAQGKRIQPSQIKENNKTTVTTNVPYVELNVVGDHLEPEADGLKRPVRVGGI